MRTPTSSPARRLATAALAALFVVTATFLATATPVGAQTDDTTADSTVQTASTLPTDNRELGNSLTRPNQGMEPQSAGDPGGWLQQSLFFVVCGAIVVISLLVWRSSRDARARRTSAGQDPGALARARGEGVRQSRSDAP